MKKVAERLWGSQARQGYLLLAAFLLLCTLLGSREIWTQEHRWADIVAGMFYRQDFFHPYLGQSTYYDKPLLSYWLMALVAKITGSLDLWALRLPSALAGVLAIGSVFSLGKMIRNKSMGLLAGWMLLTTFYFVFWARTSSADMLNVGGSMFAIAWYFSKRQSAAFFDYFIFFLIVALTSLCKGLIGAIIPLIAVFVDICLQKSWRQHFRWPLFLALVPALIIYMLPFIGSTYFNGESYAQNGLYLVYKENVLRYFQPFDHKGPIYTYFLYLPIYTLPWAVFLVPALWSLPKRWSALSIDSKWLSYTLLALFVFFTLSGSRRDYYVLPLVPFAILFIADWLTSARFTVRMQNWLVGMTAVSFILLFVGLDLVQSWYYQQYGLGRFASLLKSSAKLQTPFRDANIVLLDPESKLNFYLDLPPDVKSFPMKREGERRSLENAQKMVMTWAQNKSDEAIYISRQLYAPLLAEILPNHQMVAIAAPPVSFLKADKQNAPIAFIPRE